MASVRDVAAELRVADDEVAFLAECDPGQRAVLLAAIREAAETRDRELREAVDGALGFIPKPLRGRVMKLLGAGRG